MRQHLGNPNHVSPIRKCYVTTLGVDTSPRKGKDSLNGNKSQESTRKFLIGEVHGSLTRDANENKSKPNHDMGLVRQSKDEGLEPYFSFDAGKPKDGVSSPNRPSLDGVGALLVDILLKNANESRSKDLRWESTIIAITGSKFERIKSGGRNCGKENLDIQNDSRELLGKQDLQKPNLGESTNANVQHANQFRGMSVGDSATCNHHCRGGNTLHEGDEWGWRFLSKMDAQNPHEFWPNSSSFTPVNIILWNYRGALNPCFHLALSALINTHSHFLVIITETRVGGDRAKDIIDRPSFDGVIHFDTIGYSGRIWLLWNSDAMEIMQLAKTE